MRLRPGSTSAICRHRHHGLLRALNDQEIEGARPRAHPHPQRRRADDVVAVIIAGVVGFFGELFFRILPILAITAAAPCRLHLRRLPRPPHPMATARVRRRRRRCDHPRVVLIALAWLLSQFVKLALSPLARALGRRRIGRTDQEPGRHDLGAAQDREPRRTCRRHLGVMNYASTTRARAFTTCSPLILPWNPGCRRW